MLCNPTSTFLKRGFKSFQLLLCRIHPILVRLSHTQQESIFFNSVQVMFKKKEVCLPSPTLSQGDLRHEVKHALTILAYTEISKP